MRREPSLATSCGEAAILEKLLHQRSCVRHCGGQASKLRSGVLLAFEHEAVAIQSQMQSVPRSEPEGATHVCGNDESPLLPQYQCGIHEITMPRQFYPCHLQAQW